MTFEWKIYVRDKAFNRIGEVDEYEEATLTPAYCDVGTWSITVDRRSSQAVNLTRPGNGIVAVRNGVTVVSGQYTHQLHTVDMDRNHVQISGVSDEAWLRRRNVSPSPTESVPPYTVQAYDVRTGTASTVLAAYVNANLGPGAITPRRKAGLTIGTDPVIGSSVSGNGRWDNLLTFLQAIATSGGIGFRVVQVGNGIQFQTYQPTDRTGTVKFSIDLGNLSGFEYESTAPEANYVFVGGGGTGTARVIAERTDSASIATWDRIEGDFVDRRDTSDQTVLAQAGTDALTQRGEQASLTITPTETPASMYGVHYSLGDKVTVLLRGPSASPYSQTGQIQDILRRVEIKLTKDGPQTVRPNIGTASRSDLIKMIREMRSVKTRLNNLERQ
jgi:hypothetical protein